MAARAKYTKQVLEKKTKKFPFSSPYSEVMGHPGTTGIWIIYGKDKNGKTTNALMFAEYLGNFDKVLYVSGEEGLEDTFQDTLKRVGIDPRNRSIKYFDYTPLEELDEYLSKRQAPRIVFIDNMTIYNDELKNGAFRQFTLKHSNKLFIFLAHEEKKEPYLATAKMAKRLAKIIMRVVGLKVFVSGRCPGGELVVNEERARIYHGINNN
jgi:predicted ATP-dependent serine protease